MDNNWTIAIVPFGIVIFNKDKWSELGFSKEKIGYQVLIGLVIALCMSYKNNGRESVSPCRGDMYI